MAHWLAMIWAQVSYVKDVICDVILPVIRIPTTEEEAKRQPVAA